MAIYSAASGISHVRLCERSFLADSSYKVLKYFSFKSFFLATFFLKNTLYFGSLIQVLAEFYFKAVNV